MERLDRTFRAISFFSGLSYGMVLPVLFVFLKDKGISNVELAVLALTATITTTLLDLPSGNLADRYGRKLLFLIGQIPFLLFCVGITYAESFGALAAAMFLSGLSTALTSGTLDSLYVQKYNESKRSTSLQSRLAGLSLFSLAGTLVGAGLGIGLGVLIDTTGDDRFIILQDRLFLLVGAVALALSAFVSACVEEKSAVATFDRAKMQGLDELKVAFQASIAIFLRSRELIIVTGSGAIAAAAFMCFEKFWQIQVDQLTGEPVSRTIFYSFFCGGLMVSIVGQQLSVKLCEYFNDNLVRPVLLTRIMLVVAFAGLAFSSDMVTFGVCFVLIYLASAASASPVLALFHRYVPDDIRTSLLSIRSVSIQLGASIGILLAGLVSYYVSLDMAFVSSALLYVVSAVVLAMNARIYRPRLQVEGYDERA